MGIPTNENRREKIINSIISVKESGLLGFRLSVQHKEILAKIIRLEERFVEEDIERELYRRYRLKYDNEKEEIEKNLLLLSKQVSNLEKVTNIALKFCIELPKKWFFADYHTKQQLQQLLFPSGIFYDKKSDKCRTSKINSVFLYVAYIQQVITKKKSGIPELCLEYSAFSALVESIRGSSNLLEHCEAVVNFEKMLSNKVEGQYRKKKLL